MVDSEKFTPFEEILRAAIGPETALIHKKEDNTVMVEIKDKEKWKSVIPVLKEVFGETLFQEYEKKLGTFNGADSKHRERLQYQCEVSFSDIDQLYVVFENSEPAGFTAVENYQGSGILRDIVVKKAFRKKGLSRELYRLVFTNGKFSSILGYSKTPEAISARLSVGAECGYKSYFANQGKKPGAKMTELQQKTLDYLIEQGSVVGGVKMPAGYVLLKGELKILPAKIVQINPTAKSSRLSQPFDELNELQLEALERNKKENEGRPVEERQLPDSVAGVLVSVKGI